MQSCSKNTCPPPPSLVFHVCLVFYGMSYCKGVRLIGVSSLIFPIPSLPMDCESISSHQHNHDHVLFSLTSSGSCLAYTIYCPPFLLSTRPRVQFSLPWRMEPISRQLIDPMLVQSWPKSRNHCPCYHALPTSKIFPLL